MSLLYLKHKTIVCLVLSPRFSIIHQGLNRLAFRVNILVAESAWDSVANIMRLINVFPSKRPHSQGLLLGKKTLGTRLRSKVFYTGRLVESLSIIMRANSWSTTKA